MFAPPGPAPARFLSRNARAVSGTPNPPAQRRLVIPRPAYGRTGCRFALTLAISIAVELEQSVFTEGHCRLRDLLPNVAAVAVGLAVVLAGRALYRPMRSARG